MATLDPILPIMVALIFIIILVTILLKTLNQPNVIAYIIAGFLIGPYGFSIITNQEVIAHIGEIGVVMLLFFIGMEVPLEKIMSKWKVAVYGTLLQAVGSVIFIYILSYILHWSLSKAILWGFVISLSSTAIVIKILEDLKEIDTKVGQNVLSILIAQDIIVIPMLIILTFLGGADISSNQIIMQVIGAIIMIGFTIWLVKQHTIKTPFLKLMKKDHELQVFAGLLVCFSFAMISGFFGLSTALGAFIAGMTISNTTEHDWIRKNLHPFYVILVAVFFVSIGMLIDDYFIFQNLGLIVFLVIVTILLKTLFNAFILRLLENSWSESFYAGALLSQIGEFSFILGSIGLQLGIITMFGYQLTISVIALTLLISPFWIFIFKTYLHEKIIKHL